MGITDTGDQKKCPACGGMNPVGAVTCQFCGSLMM